MQRTQIYLTSEQRAQISALSLDAGVSQAAVIRRILDEALGLDDGSVARVAAVDATAGVLADAPDWPEWLASARGGSAADRLDALGL